MSQGATTFSSQAAEQASAPASKLWSGLGALPWWALIILFVCVAAVAAYVIGTLISLWRHANLSPEERSRIQAEEESAERIATAEADQYIRDQEWWKTTGKGFPTKAAFIKHAEACAADDWDWRPFASEAECAKSVAECGGDVAVRAKELGFHYDTCDNNEDN